MKQEIIRGRAYLFGDNINTDFINPAQYMELPMDQMIQHAMEGADPDFSKNVRPGDVMVAGINFGSGSSRETAPMVIKGSGISVLIAVSFARIFYRNAINIGLPILECEAAANGIDAGDEVEVDFDTGVITDVTKGESWQAAAFPPFIQNIIKAGGLLKSLKEREA